jgi:hypothetical protein
MAYVEPYGLAPANLGWDSRSRRHQRRRARDHRGEIVVDAPIQTIWDIQTQRDTRRARVLG